MCVFFFFQAEDGIRDGTVTGVQTCALPISRRERATRGARPALCARIAPDQESSMPDLKIGSGEWVVVCDGGKALILENAGDARFPNLRTREVYEQKHPATHELGSDVPGRAFASVGNT